jgi:hypothetical protein
VCEEGKGKCAASCWFSCSLKKYTEDILDKIKFLGLCEMKLKFLTTPNSCWFQNGALFLKTQFQDCFQLNICFCSRTFVNIHFGGECGGNLGSMRTTFTFVILYSLMKPFALVHIRQAKG